MTRKLSLCLMFGFIMFGISAANDKNTATDAKNGFVWKSDIPDDCPFERSQTLTAIFFTGRHSDYHCGDTWYPSWASDGNLYSPWTDGSTDGIRCSSGRGKDAHTGHAVMMGDDPLKLVIKNTSPPKAASAEPYNGRYVPGLSKYLMCITDGWPTVAKMTSYILEADKITGPWRIVLYMKDFGEQAYFLNLPSKFISEDGRTLWLCYSANFSPGWNGVKLDFNPPGGRYGLCLHEVRLLGPRDKSKTACSLYDD